MPSENSNIFKCDCGTLPEKLLYDASKHLILSVNSGNGPLNELPLISRISNLPSISGCKVDISPVNLFKGLPPPRSGLPIIRYLKFTRFVIDIGSSPVSPILSIYRISNSLKLPKDSGIIPGKKALSSDSSRNFSKG